MTPASIEFRAGAPRRRSPNGVDHQRRVNTGYLPDERDLIEEIARLENRTASATVRNLVMLGARAAYPELVARIIKMKATNGLQATEADAQALADSIERQ